MVCVTLAAAMLLGSCASNGAASIEPQEGKLTVFTSIYPIYDFTSRIAKDKAQVYNMTPSGTEPHDWEPTPSDIAGLEAADLLIYNGAGLEHWVDAVTASLESDSLRVVQASEDIGLISGESESDPHVWLSVKNAKKQAETIKNALIDADPDNAQAYNDNYAAFAAELDELDKQYSEALSALENRRLIVSHEAFGYLCGDYGLTQMGISGLAGESEPDPGKMADIIRYARENGISTIFYESLSSPKTAQAIADEIGGSAAPLNPLETLSAEQISSGADYISVMRDNLNTIVEALK